MRIGLGRAWNRRTASVILGVISVADSRDHEEHKRNASTAAVGELPTCVRLLRNITRLFVWRERQQRSLSLTLPTAPAAKRPVLPTRNWRQARRLSAEDQSERNCLEMCQRAHESLLASSGGCPSSRTGYGTPSLLLGSLSPPNCNGTDSEQYAGQAELLV